MFTYIIMTIIILLFWYNYKTRAKGLTPEYSLIIERKQCYKIMAVFVFFAAFHVPEPYSDFLDYVEDYPMVKSMSYAQVLDRWNDYIGYYGLSKIFADLNIPFKMWVAFTQFIYIFAIWKIVDKYSKDKILCFLFYLCMGLFSFSMQGMKQTMGHAFILYAFYFLTERKYYISVACVAYAYFCHASVMMFVPALILCYFKEYKFFPLMVVGVLLMFLSITSDNLGILVGYSDRERYFNYLEADNVYKSTTYIFYMVMLIISIIGSLSDFRNNIGSSRLFLGLSCITIALQFFATTHSFFFRLALLYQPFFYLCLANSFKSDTRKYPISMLQLTTIAMVAFYFLYSNRDALYTISLY